MLPSSPTKHIKHSQKESVYFREITQILREAALDDSQLGHATPTRIRLSADASICTVFMFTPEGEERFKEILGALILYKPSMRKALAHRIAARHTPDLIFKFDDHYEKQERLEQLFEKIKHES